MIPQIKQPPTRVAAWAEYPMNRAIADRFVGYSRLEDDPLPIVLWQDLGNGTMGLPRAACPVGTNDRRNEGARIKLLSRFEPRDEQQIDIRAKARKLLLAGESFQLMASTGVGKTALACDMIATVGRRTLVVLHKEDLIDQWAKAAYQFLGLARRDLGIIRQDKCITNAPVTLASIKTLVIDGRVPASKLRDIGFVIWDEVHLVNAETFRRSLPMCGAKLRVGLSATPHRRDGLDFIAKAHIGPVRIKANKVPMKPKVTFIETGWEPPRDQHGEVVKFGPKSGWVFKILGKAHQRNQLITRYVKLGYDSGRKLLVFSHARNHLDQLQTMAHSAGIPPAETSQYVGGLKKDAREAATKARVIFATYKMGDTGTDIPDVDAVLLTSPRAAVEQTVGRGLRFLEGKKKPSVLDFLDEKCPMFLGWSSTRRKFYTRIGAEIQHHRRKT